MDELTSTERENVEASNKRIQEFGLQTPSSFYAKRDCGTCAKDNQQTKPYPLLDETILFLKRARVRLLTLAGEEHDCHASPEDGCRGCSLEK